MAKATKKSSGWSAVRQQLTSWEEPALLALVKDLYEAEPGSRDFIQARCQTGESGSAILEKYRGKIVEQFYPDRGYGKLKLGEARKAIRDYRKATGSIAGTTELLMTYVENGAQFTREYGDVDERFYNSLESALAEHYFVKSFWVAHTSCFLRCMRAVRTHVKPCHVCATPGSARNLTK